MSYCSDCGAEVSADAAFCPNCGDDLDTESTTESPESEERLNWIEKIKLFLLANTLTFIGLILIVSVIVGFWGATTTWVVGFVGGIIGLIGIALHIELIWRVLR